MADSGYDGAALAFALSDLPVEVLVRLRSDRVMLREVAGARTGPQGGRPRKHGSPSP